jgi:hypothetical protein
MQSFYVRNGRRIQIPPTIPLLDEISPGYRAKLIGDGQEPLRAPKAAPDLPDLMHGLSALASNRNDQP